MRKSTSSSNQSQVTKRYRPTWRKQKTKRMPSLRHSAVRLRERSTIEPLKRFESNIILTEKLDKAEEPRYLWRSCRIQTSRQVDYCEYKARLVLKGYSQGKDIDYKKLFIGFETVWLILSLVAKEELINQFISSMMTNCLPVCRCRRNNEKSTLTNSKVSLTVQTVFAIWKTPFMDWTTLHTASAKDQGRVTQAEPQSE